MDSRILISQLSVRSNDLFSGHERWTSDHFHGQTPATLLAPLFPCRLSPPVAASNRKLPTNPARSFLYATAFRVRRSNAPVVRRTLKAVA